MRHFLLAWAQAWALITGAAVFGLVWFGGIFVGWTPILEVALWATFPALAFTIWLDMQRERLRA